MRPEAEGRCPSNRQPKSSHLGFKEEQPHWRVAGVPANGLPNHKPVASLAGPQGTSRTKLLRQHHGS